MASTNAGGAGRSVSVRGGKTELTLGAGYAIVGIVDAYAGQTNTLVLGGSEAASFDLAGIGSAAQYRNFTALEKSGNSVWTLTNTGNAFSSTTFGSALAVRDGTVMIDEGLSSLDVALSGTATIGGFGAIRNLTANGGFIAPGNSVGTFAVMGSANFTGVTYNAEVEAAGVADLLVVGGAAHFNGTGNTVVVQPLPGAYSRNKSYIILTSDEIVGKFQSVTSASPLFDVALRHTPNLVFVDVARKDLATVVPDLTANQLATAVALESTGTTAPLYFTELMGVPASDIPAAFSALSGDGYASLLSSLMGNSALLRDTVFGRLATARKAPGQATASNYYAKPEFATPTTGSDLWLEAYRGFSTLAGGNGPAVDTSAGGLAMGFDGATEFGRLGGFVATGTDSFGLADREMTGTAGSFTAGIYGDTQWDAFYVSLGASLTGREVATTRTVGFAADTYRASYGAFTTQGFAEIGHAFDFGATAFTPFAGIALVNTVTTAFTETGSGPGGLTVAAASSTAAVATLGARVEHQFVVSGTTLVTLSGSAAWRHVAGDAATTSNSFAGGTPFTVAGTPLPSALVLGAGANLDISDSLALGLTYSGAFNAGATHAVSAKISGSF